MQEYALLLLSFSSLPSSIQRREARSPCSQRTEKCSGDSSSSRQRNPFCYDRGHIVMANHIDGSGSSQTRNADASFVTNLVPQASGTRGGSWFETDQIIECHHDFPNV
jgi:hypothetical protein